MVSTLTVPRVGERGHVSCATGRSHQRLGKGKNCVSQLTDAQQPKWLVRDDVANDQEHRKQSASSSLCHWLHIVNLSSSVTRAVNCTHSAPCSGRSSRCQARKVRSMPLSFRADSVPRPLLSLQGRSDPVTAQIQKSQCRIRKIGGNHVADLATRNEGRVFAGHLVSSRGRRINNSSKGLYSLAMFHFIPFARMW